MPLVMKVAAFELVGGRGYAPKESSGKLEHSWLCETAQSISILVQLYRLRILERLTCGESDVMFTHRTVPPARPGRLARKRNQARGDLIRIEHTRRFVPVYSAIFMG
jgi:hypothetical protein